MWGVAKIFTSGHSKGGFDRTPRTPPGYGYVSLDTVEYHESVGLVFM